MLLARPLPGIRFEAEAPSIGDALPRMDIPVFVGFAASGPLHRPVAVEDVAQFAMIFGAGQVLPREAGASAPVQAYLAPAVRAFFANGGRRCWIVRVARTRDDGPPGTKKHVATANRFRIPELQRIANDGSLGDAFGVARSEGSWSDALRVRTNLVGRLMRVAVFDPSALAVEVVVSSPREVSRGDLIRVTWLAGTPSDSPPVLFLFVAGIGPTLSSPPRRDGVRLTGRTVWVAPPPASPPTVEGARTTRRTRWVLAQQPDVKALAGTPFVERLTFDLTVRAPGQPPWRMNGLGFAPEHARHWAALPTDANLFDPDAVSSELWRDAATPRFPLAAEADGFYLPTADDALFSEDAAAEVTSDTPLERDGLAQFDAGLFIDRGLAEATVRDLLDRADFIRYQSSDARPLEGIHAALGIEEATMVAVPDAVHRGWRRDEATPLASPPASSPLAHPEWWRWLDCRDPRPPTPGAPNAGFIDCDVAEPIGVPPLTATAPANGSFELRWAPAAGAIDELEEATRPDFSDAAVVARGSSGRVALHGRTSGDFYYRLRRLRGSRSSDYSNGIGLRIGAADGWVSGDAGGFDDSPLRAIHGAVVTMCAARGDLVGLLALPAHYDGRQAIAHTARLGVPPQALSYGALWHPWLIVRDDNAGPLRAAPPDGAMAGVLAARANARGAWIAPANEPLRGPVALTPSIPPELRQALQDAGVNVIRQEPSGFVCLDADTLSTDDEVRPLNVRRLLALVRRAALRLGNAYVFEPNDARARRAVRRAFEALLETLFARGAFAGRTERAAFQVVTDDSLNPPGSVDAGRLIAEIRIAPSRPLSFLTIRLVQHDDVAVVQGTGP